MSGHRGEGAQGAPAPAAERDVQIAGGGPNGPAGITERDAPIAAGELVPSFSLARDGGARFTEADLDGQTTVLVFYPFAFSPVCSDQLSLYDAVRDEFAAQGAVLYGVSCDSTWAQRAFTEKLGVTIEQLSDFEPKGATCRAFGVYHPGGFPQRALVIAGPDGRVVWSYQAASPGDLPGANLIFDALVATPAA